MPICYHNHLELSPRFMKPLRYATNAEQARYMRLMKEKNVKNSKNNPNELWLFAILKSSGLKWSRQRVWGYRIFDFWCHHLGCAVECDGPEHDPDYDSYRDEYNLRRSGIIVLHVRNKNEDDAKLSLEFISKLETWSERRDKMGLNSHSKKSKRKWVSNPESELLLI